MSQSNHMAILASFDSAALAAQKDTLDASDIDAIRRLFLFHGGTMRDLVMTKDGGLAKRLQEAIETVSVHPPEILTATGKGELYKAGALAVIRAINPVLRESAVPAPAAAVILDALERASAVVLDPLPGTFMPTSAQAFFSIHGDTLRHMLANWRPTQPKDPPSLLQFGCVGIALQTMRDVRGLVTGDATSRIDAAIEQIERLTGDAFKAHEPLTHETHADTSGKTCPVCQCADDIRYSEIPASVTIHTVMGVDYRMHNPEAREYQCSNCDAEWVMYGQHGSDGT